MKKMLIHVEKMDAKILDKPFYCIYFCVVKKTLMP